MAPTKNHGLQLTGENGEPGTAHAVPPLPGYYFTNVPTPVGGEGQLSLEAAKNALKDPVDEDGKRYEDGFYGLGDVLKLVTIKPSETDEAGQVQADALAAAKNGIADARRDARDRPLSEEERQRINAETAAATGDAGEGN